MLPWRYRWQKKRINWFETFSYRGLSPDLKRIEQIREINRPVAVPDAGKWIFYFCFHIFIDVKLGLLCDLLWSDPDETINNWDENNAGISHQFGVNVLNKVKSSIVFNEFFFSISWSKFMDENQLDLVCRSHQVWKEINENWNGNFLFVKSTSRMVSNFLLGDDWWPFFL